MSASKETEEEEEKGGCSIKMTLPPSPPSPSPPPLDQFNTWADYWYYELGLNVIPAKTRIKKTFIQWSQWQLNAIPQEQFEEWKRTGEFADGMAVIAGKAWRGRYQGKYFTFIDLDNLKAIEEFCTRNDITTPLEKFAEQFIVERHLDNINKAHVFFFSEVAFGKKSSEVGKPGVDPDSIPIFEVKGKGTHGIAYCTPSYHKGGHQYQILGTLAPIVLDKRNAIAMMKHLDSICKKYGLSYRDNGKDGNGSSNGKSSLTPMSQLEKDDFVIYEGQNRHEHLLRYMESRIVIYRDRVPLEEIRELCYIWNQQHCKGPLDDNEFEKQWKAAQEFIKRKDRERGAAGEEKKEQQQQEQEQQQTEQVSERSVSDIIRMKKGLGKTRAKIVGVSEPYKMISRVTLSCSECNYEGVFDYSKMPLMIYKKPRRYCPDCYSLEPRKLSDLSDLIDHVDAMSIQLQDADTQDADTERLHVILLEDHTRGVRVGETVMIMGEVSVLNPTGVGGKKPTTVVYARDVRYDRAEEAPITDDDITLFRDFEKKYGTDTPLELAKMFAPQVIGHTAAKVGILRSAVNIKEARHITGFRTRIHTDLVGDPGTAKSILAKEATKITPNAKWVTSQHTAIKSALAIFDKDPELGTMLMLGPVPQAKNSICGVNEFDSLSLEDQQHLADALEEGQFTKTAHGRSQEIDSPTTIISTVNPEGGYWDKTRSSPSLDQIPIRSNIRDRFDQHYIFQDFKTDEECQDFAAQKAEHYLNPETVKADYDFLKRYLQYAASLPVPKLTLEASSMLSFFWRRMRNADYASNRTLDSLYRVAQAQARLHLKSEIDTGIAQEVMRDIQLMFVQLGKRVDPSVEDPRILAYDEIIQYTNTLSFPIEFTEALKHVYEHNDLVRHYLGSKIGAIEWAGRENKKVRAIYDKFTDGGTGQLKIGTRGLAVAIQSLKPLTLVKAEGPKEEGQLKVGGEEKEQQQPQQQQKNDFENTGSHRSHRSPDEGKNHTNNVLDNPNEPSDPSDLCDLDFEKRDLQIMAILKTLLNDKETFTEDDFLFKCSMWPNLGWSIQQAKQAFNLLLQKGRIMEIEEKGGKYKTTTEELSSSRRDS